MTRILLLIPSRTYRTRDFVEAARALDVEVVVGTEHPAPIGDPSGGHALQVSLDDAVEGSRAIVDFAREHPLDAVVPVDDGSTLVAAAAAAALGLAHNRFEAVAASDSASGSSARAAQRPALPTWPADADPEEVPTATFPVVVKPVDLSEPRRHPRRRPDALVAAFARVATRSSGRRTFAGQPGAADHRRGLHPGRRGRGRGLRAGR